MRQNIGPADVTASFAEGDSKLKSRSWVATEKNLFFVQLENTGTTALPLRAEILDAFGRDDRETIAGAAGDVDWLRVSPEVVAATIGGSKQRNTRAPFAPPAPARKITAISDAGVRSVQIFSGYLRDPPDDSRHRPLYAWTSHGVLAGRSGTSGGASPGVYSCGDIILPQRAFTVAASMNMNRAHGQGVIFSALVDHLWKKTHDRSDRPAGKPAGT